MKDSVFTPKKLVFCAIAIAIGFVLSYVQLFKLPWGGAVTLCSMLMISLPGYWFGPIIGIITAFIYGILQFFQEPFVLTPFQVCCDYLFAFACLGFTGFFRNKKFGFELGYLIGIIGRGIFHAIGGYLYWMEYMPEDFPAALSGVYPIVYNFSYILAEGVITLVIISIPSVKRAIEKVGQMARE